MIGRTLLAVALCAGFYATGVVVVLLLAWLPWAQAQLTGGVQLSGIVALVGAGYVVWALVPPWHRWEPPGPELSEEGQPELWAMVRRVAEAAGHPMPRHLYVVFELTAFAASRPRWLGLRREPIIALGLPAFAVLTDNEMSAVLAHEFGHHAGGDVRLGPWQYRTRRAIAAALDRLDGSSLFLHLPFYAYGRLYLRLTGGASRAQELRADALAARIGGARELGEALIAFEHHDSRWLAYWYQVFVPMVDLGMRAPILEGYRRYLSSAPALVEEPTPDRPPDPGDTHPPLAVRLAALGVEMRARESTGESRRSLLAGDEEVEDRLLRSLLAQPSKLAELTPIAWDEWGEKVLPRLWKERAGPALEVFQSVAVSSLPSLLQDDNVWHRLRQGSVNVFSPEARRRHVRAWLGCWLGLALHGRGFRVTSGPGAPPALERDGLRVEPFQWTADLAAGRRTEAEWAALWASTEPAAPRPPQ